MLKSLYPRLKTQIFYPFLKDKACFGSKYSMFWVEIYHVLPRNILCFWAKYTIFLSEIMHKIIQLIAYLLIYNTLLNPSSF